MEMDTTMFLNEFNRKKLIFLTLIFTLSIDLSASPSDQKINGFWSWEKNGETGYLQKYLRIKNNIGFYCILDHKSSFKFKIIGDSIYNFTNNIGGVNYSDNLLIISSKISETVFYDKFKNISESNYLNKCEDADPNPMTLPEIGLNLFGILIFIIL